MPFICTIDTVFQGQVASWRDESGRPIVYDTEEEAKEDACDPELAALDEDYEMDGVESVSVTPTHIIGTHTGRVYWTLGEKR